VWQTVDYDFDVAPWAVRWAALYAWACVGLAAALMSLQDRGANGRGSGPRLMDDFGRRGAVVAFGVAWAWVALAPRLVMRIPEHLNEHQLYFPVIGLCLAAAAGAQATTSQEER
jgi:hypothetical protein